MKAVKFYSTMPPNDENILNGISGNIPAIVICGEENLQAPDETYTVMADDSYQNYLSSISTNLDQWKIIQEQEELQ